MGPDLENKGRLGSMANLEGKENEKYPGEPVAKSMSCVSNYQDDIFDWEASQHKQAEQVTQVKKLKANITGLTRQSENFLNETALEDETENSSSFGNTLSGDETYETFSDSEVMSNLHDKGYDQECRMRKKTLTSHWKTYIQPYMWRCRWAELQIRRLLHQVSRYDLQARAISRRQQLKSKNSTIKDTGAKSLPTSAQEEALIARRKRKRMEDSADTATYMAQHPLFSNLGSKKSGADVASSLNDWTNIGIPKNNRIDGDSVFGCGNEPVSLEFRNDDNSLEQILWKIGVLQSHLGELKTRFKKVHDENAKDIDTADAMNLNDVSTTSAQNDVSTNEREKLVQVSSVASQLMPTGNRCEMLMSGSAISTHGESSDLIDIIECKDQLQIVLSCEEEGDGHLIYHSTAKEPNNIDKVKIQPREKPETPKEEEQANTVSLVPVVSISDYQSQTPKEEQPNMAWSVPVPVKLIADDEPTPKKRSISGLTSSPHNTRSRGRGRGRRRGGRWSRRA